MFGFSLIHAGFLAAGLAVAVPVVIHLLFRQKTRTMPIGSVRFLHQVIREHRRRRRLRQWLLLALRMLAVLLLAALFARPYRDQSAARGLEHEVVFLVDRSASMGARDNSGRTAIERALDEAQSRISRLDDNVVVHLAACDAAQVKVLPVDELRTIKATAAATDYAMALSWAGDLLAGSNRTRREIVLLCDMQRSGLPRGSAVSIPEGIDLAVVDVGQPAARNVAIEAVDAVRIEIRPDGEPALRTVLRNYGPLKAKGLSLACRLDAPDGSTLTKTVKADIEGQGRTVVDLPLALPGEGLYQGSVSIGLADALEIDNQRFVAFEARRPDRVLLVDGEEGRSIFGNETYYLETALRLRDDDAGIQRSFEVERIVWESGKGFPRLDGYRAVVLANVRLLAAADGKRLGEFVRGGGNLVVFAGGQVTAASLAPLVNAGLLPGQPAAGPIEGRFRIDRWNSKHPALACFADPQQGDLRRVVFTTILPLETLAKGAVSLLESKERIVLAEISVGDGLCLYCGSSADRDWTDLPRTRLYVPLMRQLLAYLTRQLAERSAVTNRLVTKPGDQVGIEAAVDRLVVTNLDARESVLDRTTADDLRKAFAARAPAADRAAEAELLGITIPPDALRPDEIWTIVAWVLLFVLAVETLLAGRVHA